ncbi:hypothetical protein V8E55_005365 [Tylopilus felleus]
MAAVRDAGHEIGLHGYSESHENPSAMSLEHQRDTLDHTYKLLAELNLGKLPKGSVTPWWETSKEGTALLLEKSIEYNHSNMSHDSQAYYPRDEDHWTKIDYSVKAETWMKPLTKGNETGIVEIPANWYLDDLSPMMFIRSSSNSHGWVNARDVEQLRKDTFTCLYREHSRAALCFALPEYREEGDFIFPVTIHPDASGRPHVLLPVMLPVVSLPRNSSHF